MPNNKAFKYNVMMESYKGRTISRKETRKYLIDELGIPVSEVPETIQEQQELGIFDTDTMPQTPQMQEQSQGNIQNYVNQEPNVQGLTGNGNVSLNQVRGGL